MGDAASKDEIYGSGEEGGVFEREWALFREENLETLIDGDLRLVGFDLGKIGTQSGVEDQGILEDDFGIEAGTRFEALPVKMGHAAGTIIQAAERAQRTIGNKLDVAAGRDFSESIGVCFLREPALLISSVVRVKGKLVTSADFGLKGEGPVLPPVTGATGPTGRAFRTLR